MPSRMLELIRQSAVPASVMRSAARGALSLPPSEMIEVLVHLTTSPVFGEQARMTLAGWDEPSSRAVAADPATAHEVLEYLLAPQNRRPCLLPALLENPSVPDSQLIDMAQTAKRDTVEMMVASARVRRTRDVLYALLTNEHLSEAEIQELQRLLNALGDLVADDVLAEETRSPYEIEHADEIRAEQAKPFQLLGDILDLGLGDDRQPSQSGGGEPSAPILTEVAAALAAHAATQHHDPEVQQRVSTLKRIAQLSVGERVQLAMKGTREERFILIRDGARVVSCAVLESPKLTDNEVEVYASMKNVQETVLRTIAMKRKFMKVYAVVRALVSNPRTPIDVSLALMNHLLLGDLKHLSMNKNIPDTIRSLALRRVKQKTSAGGGGSG